MTEIIVADLRFRRVNEDTWCAVNIAMLLHLDMSTPSRPWRTCYNGHTYKSKFSTPYVAVVRTLTKKAEYESRKQNAAQ